MAIGYLGNNGNNFHGEIDEVSVYSNALSAANVATLYRTVGSGITVGNTSPAMPSTPVVIATGGTLDLNGMSQQVVSLADAGPGSAGTVISSTAGYVPSTLTLSPTGGTTTFSGMIAGGGTLGTIKLVMSGSGTQVLAGTNTYTGGTEASSGTLDFARPSAVPSTGVVTFDAGGYVALGRLLGASSPATDATDTATETSATSGTVATALTASEGGAVATGGGASLGGTGSIAGVVPAAAVPEPSTVVLLGVAVVGLLGYARRRRRTSAPHARESFPVPTFLDRPGSAAEAIGRPSCNRK